MPSIRGGRFSAPVPSRRLPEVKQIVSQADPTAFVLVSAVSEIIGRGFSMPR